MRTREEEPHNTPEQVRSYLTEALNLTNELDDDEPERVRAAIFSAAVNLISSKQIMFIETAMGGVADLGNLARRH